MVRQRKLWKWDDVVSLAASIFICLVLAVPILQGEYYFGILAIIAAVEMVITLLNACIKNKMLVVISETVHSFLFSLVIVLFALFGKSEKAIYPLLIASLAVVAGVKTAIAIYHERKYRLARNVDYHTSGNHNFISALTYAQMLCFVLTSLLNAPNGNVWRIGLDLGVNFIVTNIVTTDAMFMLVRMYTDEKLGFFGKVRFIISTLIEKDVFIYIGFFFSSMVVIFTFLTGLNGTAEVQEGYYAMSVFYFTIFLTRIVSHFVWKKANKRNYSDWELGKTKARLSLFTSIALLVEGETIGTALIFFMQNKEQDKTPIWWFFLFLLPFALWRGVSCIMYLIKAKKTGDLQVRTYGTIDLVSAGFSLGGVLAMAYYYMQGNEYLAKFIYGFVVALQIFATIMIVRLFIESIVGLAKKPPKETEE